MHFCAGLVGWTAMLTLYAARVAAFVRNSNVPERDTGRSSPPLLRSTSPLPISPMTEPPTGLTAGAALSRPEHPARMEAPRSATDTRTACGARGPDVREGFCTAAPDARR